MKTIPVEFRNKIYDDEAHYIVSSDFEFEDGTLLSGVTNNQIWTGGFSYEEAVSEDDSFTALGGVVIGSATLILNNIDDDFSMYDFANAKVTINLVLQLSESRTTNLAIGVYTVDEAEYNGATIRLTLLDNMAQFDRPYSSSSINYASSPTLLSIVQDACSKCGVALANSSLTFPHRTYQLSAANAPDKDSTTFREVLSYVATVAGCYVKCNPAGELELKWFDTTALDELHEGLDGGYFDGGRSGVDRVRPYLNTTTGMTLLPNSNVDDAWFSIENEIEFEWNGVVSEKIFIDSDSCIYFGNEEPTDHGHTTIRDINIFTRNGRSGNIRYQLIAKDDWSAIKIYFSGNTRTSSSSTTVIQYEIFLVSDGYVYINVIQVPSISSYLGTSSIVENGVSTAFTPAVGVMYAHRSDTGWLINNATSYQSGDTADGGSFNPWSVGDVIDSGTFADYEDIHFIWGLNSQTMSVDDVVITGVIANLKDEEGNITQSDLVGTSGYVLELDENPFITSSNVNTILNWLGTALIGLRFRKLNVTHRGDPSIEAGDVAVVIDRKQNMYPILVTRMTFSADGLQTVVCGASTPSRNSVTKYSSSTKSYVEARKLLNKETSAIDQAIESLEQAIATSAGLYCTRQTDSTGTIYYLHDQQQLASSKIVWRMSDKVISVTTDYKGSNPSATVWNTGITADGSIIAKRISALGIAFDWAIGTNIVLGGQNNTSGKLTIKNASGQTIGYWDNTGIHASAGSFEGSIYSESGEIASFTIAGDSLYTKSHSGVDSNSPGVYVGGAGVSCASSWSQKAVMRDGYIQLTTNEVNAAVVDPTCGVYLETANGAYRTFIAANMMLTTYDNGVGELQETTFLADRTGIYTNGEKNRIVKTPDYSKRLMYCYETSAPMFGDVGEGEIGENGETRIYIDPVFAETISADGYQVFLQKYGIGECYVSERNGAFFTVNGEPGLRFGWELKAKQFDLDQRRLDIFKQTADPETRDYGADAINHITEIEQERRISA